MEVNGQALAGVPVPPECVDLHGLAVTNAPQALFFQKILALHGTLRDAFPRRLPAVHDWGDARVCPRAMFGASRSGGFVAMSGLNQNRRFPNMGRFLHPDKIRAHWDHDPEFLGWVPCL